MMKITEVIRRPLVTEKTTLMRDDGKTIVFEVARDANAYLMAYEAELSRCRMSPWSVR